MSDAHFRRSVREPVNLRVQFRRDAADAELEKAGRVRDLSMGGVFITCSVCPPVDALLRLYFSLPSAWDLVELPAEVRWTNEEGFGAAFRALNARQADSLLELIQKLGFDEAP